MSHPFQIIQWKTLMNTDIDPLLWGWKMGNNKLAPIMTDEVCIPFYQGPQIFPWEYVVHLFKMLCIYLVIGLVLGFQKFKNATPVVLTFYQL